MTQPGSERLRSRAPWGLAALAAGLAAVPLLNREPYILSTLIVVGLYALVGTGLGLLMGHAGQVSLGQSAFYGIGAYTTALLSVRLGWSPWAGILAAVLLAAAVAWVLGLLTLRLEGDYLALATLAFGVIVYILLVEMKDLTGGPSGIVAVPALSLPGFAFKNDLRWYYLVWGLVLAGLLVYRNVVSSRVGRALRAIQGSEYAARALGIDVGAYKLQVFVLSAAYAALPGALYAHYISFISPSPFNFHASIQFLIIGVIGGLSSLWGSVFGAAAVVVLAEVLKEVVPRLIRGAGGEFEIIVYGLLLVVILIFAPEGLGGALDRLAGRRRRPTAAPPAGAAREGSVASD